MLILFIPAFSQEGKLFQSIPAKQSGITFRNQLTESPKANVLTYEYFYNGGGVAVGDINNDGLEDIYFTANMQPNKLYLNLGNFKFKDITREAGVAGRNNWKTGVTMVDINGDGLLDIYVCYSGNGALDTRRNELFINRGNLHFEEQAKAYGLDDPSHSTQATFFDFDLDGDLDMYLLNHNMRVSRDIEYEKIRHTRHPFAGDKLFRNDNGHFTDISEQAGIKGSPLGFGLSVAISDINKDGWPDIYVCNDYMEPDYLYMNQKNGLFTDQLTECLQHISYYSMGSDVQDVNNDGWSDIFTVDMLPEDNRRQKLLYGPSNYEQYALQVMNGYYHQSMRNMLQLNNANPNNGLPVFSEIGQLAGISNTDWSWASLLADYDNDGWKDLFITNGYYRDYTNRDFLKYRGDYYFQQAVARQKADTFNLLTNMPSTPLHSYMFKSKGDLTFSDQSKHWGFDRKGFSNGAAYTDLDNDGDLDLVVNNLNEEASVYQNRQRELQPTQHYVTIRLKGSGKNTQGYGSKVYVYAGTMVQYQEQMPVRGYQSSVSPRLHMGLGSVVAIDSIKVVWPSGKISLLRQVKADQRMDIDESSSLSKQEVESKLASVFSKVSSPVPFQHIEYGLNDFKRQPLMMTMLSTCGPVLATADVNGDGLVDMYAGGAKENPGKLFIQQKAGNFLESTTFAFTEDAVCTDADALFFDADKDGDLDLYVASGGYNDYEADDAALQDRLYLNDGKGNFTRTTTHLPELRAAKACVRAADIDGDGDTDLFIGGRVIPGQYPLSPDSYLLQNDGKGHFSNVISTAMPALQKGGMLTDAAWIDLNKDRWPDLVVVGECMPIRVFLSQQGKRWEEATKQFFAEPLDGLWSRLAVADFDHDGDEDLIAGNFGLNSQIKASPQEPISLVYKDFDKNGSVDPIMSYFIEGKSYPFASRDELLDQVYSLRKKFTSYASYSEARLSDIFSPEDLHDASEVKVNTLQTTYLENQSGTFVSHSLPLEAQFAPVYAIEIGDYNLDGHPDFILAGNQSAIRIRMGVIDASYGQLFTGDGKGNFHYVPQAVSGLRIIGDAKSVKRIRIKEVDYLLVGVNNMGVEAYQINKK